MTVARGLDVRDFTLTTFGGSGSLLACRLMDILGLPRTLVPPNPGNVSAFGLLTVDVRNDYVQTVVSKHVDLDLDRVQSVFADLEDPGADRAGRRGLRPRRAADAADGGPALRRPGVRGAGAGGRRRARTGGGEPRRSPRPSTPPTGSCTATTSPTDPRQAVEWVNLRVSGIGPIRRPDLVELPAQEGGTDRAVTGSRRVFFDDWVDTPTYDRPDLAPGDVVTGPAIIEEFGSTVPVHPGFAVTVDRYGNLLLTKESDR